MADVNVYSEEMVLKFIMGVEPLSKFDEYVGKIKELGIEEAIAVTQSAVDRFMEN
jgi:putative aldouronate transport system substrate-binding protein